MVKKAKAKKASAGGRTGRPPIPEDKIRTARIAIRAHQDLVDALDVIAEDVGLVRSVLVERAIIAWVNEHYGRRVLNGIGKRNTGVSSLAATFAQQEAFERKEAEELGAREDYLDREDARRAKGRDWVTDPRPFEQQPNSQRIFRPRPKK